MAWASGTSSIASFIARAGGPCYVSILAVLLLAISCRANTTQPTTMPASPDPRFAVAQQLHAEQLADMNNFAVELEAGGAVEAKEGVLSIDVPAGCTVWFRPKLEGAVLIEYDATVISAGGANDRVSDLNCFWMASDARSPGDHFATARSGKFADYNQLNCYYVGHGGNANTTTRFRRYIGQRDSRPLLPEHDLKTDDVLLKPNATYRIRLIAAGNVVQYWCDDRMLFGLDDAAPYTSGHFGWRTVTSHIEVRNFRVWRLRPSRPPS